jgi:Uma2 family endonuclease
LLLQNQFLTFVENNIVIMAVPLRTSLPSVTDTKIRKMSLERFRVWRPLDGWKYDWNNGKTTKYKQMVTEKQRYIVQNLLDAFYEKGLYKTAGMMPESEMAYDDNRYRVPDMAYYTKEQTKAAANGEHTVSPFVIEILSDTDLAKNIEIKLWEYFEEGVKVVWHVIPYKQIVKVYTSPFKVSICKENEVCSAASASIDFDITPNAIFNL